MPAFSTTYFRLFIIFYIYQLLNNKLKQNKHWLAALHAKQATSFCGWILCWSKVYYIKGTYFINAYFSILSVFLRYINEPYFLMLL